MHPHRHRLSRRTLATAALAAAAALLLPAHADSPSLTPATTAETEVSSVDLKASRMVGFAPMAVDVSGTVLDGDGRAIALPADLQATLILESSNLRFGSGHRPTSVFTGKGEQIPSAQDLEMSRSLVIHQPGTYTLRWVVKDGDREVVLSDEVRIRVL